MANSIIANIKYEIQETKSFDVFMNTFENTIIFFNQILTRFKYYLKEWKQEQFSIINGDRHYRCTTDECEKFLDEKLDEIQNWFESIVVQMQLSTQFNNAFNCWLSK